MTRFLALVALRWLFAKSPKSIAATPVAALVVTDKLRSYGAAMKESRAELGARRAEAH